MNDQQRAALQPLLLKDVEETGKEFGRGAYGVVTEVIVSGTVCAAKKLHDAIVQVKLTRHYTLAELLFIQEHTLRRFSEEVLLHSQQRHPNIVQLIGVHYPRGSQLPMLVMEFLPFSLTQCLEKEDLPLVLKYSILHDVAKGLCYLHGKRPPIVHRDLTANNILLTFSSYTAKISDLGVSRLAGTFKTHEPLTAAPGNAIVMPPEALKDEPFYNHKLDVFAYGCLIIHVLTQEFPVPTDAYERQLFFLQRKVPECDRRLKYMQKVQKENEILPLAKQCLDDNPNSRPDMIKALQFVGQVLEKYPKNTYLELIRQKETAENVLEQFAMKYTAEIVAKESEIETMYSKLKRVSMEVSRLECLLHTKQEELDTVIAERESEIERNESINREVRNVSQIIQEKEIIEGKLHQLVSMHKLNAEALEAEIKGLHLILKKTVYDKETTERKLQRLTKKYESNEKIKKEMQSRLEKLSQEKERQNLQKACLERRVEAMKGKLREFHQQVETMEGKLYNLRQRIQAMEGELSMSYQQIQEIDEKLYKFRQLWILKVHKFCCQWSRKVLEFHQRWKSLLIVTYLMLIFVIVCVMWNWNNLVFWGKVKVFVNYIIVLILNLIIFYYCYYYRDYYYRDYYY